MGSGGRVAQPTARAPGGRCLTTFSAVKRPPSPSVAPLPSWTMAVGYLTLPPEALAVAKGSNLEKKLN